MFKRTLRKLEAVIPDPLNKFLTFDFFVIKVYYVTEMKRTAIRLLKPVSVSDGTLKIPTYLLQGLDDNELAIIFWILIPEYKLPFSRITRWRAMKKLIEKGWIDPDSVETVQKKRRVVKA